MRMRGLVPVLNYTLCPTDPNIQCWVTGGRQLYLLRYWIHHSVCYTVLFTTAQVVITVLLVTLSSDPLMSRFGAVFWCLLSWMLAADRLTVINRLFVTDYLWLAWLFTLKQISRTGYSTPCRKVHASIAASWLLKKQLTVDSIRCHRDVFSFWGITLILLLAICCSGNVLPFCLAKAMDFNIPAFRHGLPSLCLVMDVLSGKSTSDLTPLFQLSDRPLTSN
jgi:hypothetical protein